MFRTLFVAVLAVAATAPHAQVPVTVAVEEAFPGTTFRRPVGVEQTPATPDVVYVVEQGGGPAAPRVVAVDAAGATTTVLDLSDRAIAGGELGLLGLAFHPDYAANGRVFVSYTAAPTAGGAASSRLSEFARDAADPLAIDPASERVLLAVEQPADNHNGGTVRFDPEGLLYWSLGDGGGQGDPFDNGQDPTTLLGAILRIDVDAETLPYGIPDDNPFAATDGPERDEIFAYGFRNPFKFSAQASGIWVGDVGQDRWEEVDLAVAGGNYGWNEVEGPECFTAGCELGAFLPPVVAYDHGPDGGFSITGGFVVEARDLALTDQYVYGDFVTGRFWSVPVEGGEPTLLLDQVPTATGSRSPLISSIDPGRTGAEIFLTDYSGRIYRIDIGATAAEGGPAALPLAVVGPNPFREGTSIAVGGAGPVRVTLVDVRGREVAVLHDGPPGRVAVPGGLAPGAYAVVARSASGVAVRWLVRAR